MIMLIKEIYIDSIWCPLLFGNAPLHNSRLFQINYVPTEIGKPGKVRDFFKLSGNI